MKTLFCIHFPYELNIMDNVEIVSNKQWIDLTKPDVPSQAINDVKQCSVKALRRYKRWLWQRLHD